MKTITKIIIKEVPQLIIRHDEFTESPRAWVNVGYFFTKERRYNSPDGTDHELYDCMLEGEEHASNTEEHMEYIKTFAKRDYDIDVIHITPVYRYEHGRILYKRGTTRGFDVSNCGFYIVTKETAEDMGVDPTDTSAMDIYIDGELDTYTKYVNGEVYGYELFDESGERIDSCWGFYDLEDIRQELPDEWKEEDLAEYIQW